MENDGLRMRKTNERENRKGEKGVQRGRGTKRRKSDWGWHPGESCYGNCGTDAGDGGGGGCVMMSQEQNSILSVKDKNGNLILFFFNSFHLPRQQSLLELKRAAEEQCPLRDP